MAKFQICYNLLPISKSKLFRTLTKSNNIYTLTLVISRISTSILAQTSIFALPPDLYTNIDLQKAIKCFKIVC